MGVVVRLPLDGLVHPDGTALVRGDRLKRAEVGSSMGYGTEVSLVVSTIGKPLVWRGGDEMRAFWKADASMRIASPNEGIDLDRFPDGRCYLACLWTDGEGGHRTVELQEFH